MPELRRPLRFHLPVRGLSRVAAHLSVVALVIVSTAVGLQSTQGGVDTATQHGYSFGLVSAVRGAAEQETALRSAHFDLAPDPRSHDLMLERRVLPTPLPTPLAVPVTPPPATPEPAVSTHTTFAAPPARSGSLLWPVIGGQISQYFHSGHPALDIAAPYNSSVVAAQSGVVIWSGWRNNGGGWVIEVDHGNGLHTVYNHLGKLLVSAGQQVARGQRIALVGCTGNCTGPHVHFEVTVNGVDVNPLRYL